MSKDWHTPWKISSGLTEHSRSILIYDANGVWVASALGSHDKTLPCGCEQKLEGFPTDEEAEAIARLIIAAPALVEELKELVEQADDCDVDCDKARQAIARATEGLDDIAEGES